MVLRDRVRTNSMMRTSDAIREIPVRTVGTRRHQLWMGRKTHSGVFAEPAGVGERDRTRPHVKNKNLQK